MPAKFLPTGVGLVGGRTPALVALAAWFALAGAVPTVAETDGKGPSSLAAQPAIETNALLEQFKAFISSPPPISNIVFQQKAPMGGGFRPLDGSFASSSSFEYFQARWQTDGLLFRRLNSPTNAADLTFADQLVSWSGHQHAVIEPGNVMTTWDDRDPSVEGKDISVFYTSQFFLQPLRELLNLGIMYAGIGAVHWEGNRFHVETEVDHQHLRINGHVSCPPNGPPDHLTVHYEFSDRNYDYVVRYGYEPALGCKYLPTVITNLWIRRESATGASKEIELNEWRILNLTFAESPITADAFDVAPFLMQGQFFLRIYTNNALFHPDTNGTLVQIMTFDGRTLRGVIPASRVKLAVYYASWGGVNIVLFALIVGARETETKQQIRKEANNDEIQA